MVFGQAGHSRSAAARSAQYSAVADSRGRNPRIGSNFERLQSATGHTSRRDLVCIELLIIRARLVAVLRDGPIYCVGQEGRFRGTAGTAALTFCRHGADGDNKKTV